MTGIDFATYIALGALVLAGISSMLITLTCLRELSSFDRHVIRMEKLIDLLEENLDRGTQ